MQHDFDDIATHESRVADLLRRVATLEEELGIAPTYNPMNIDDREAALDRQLDDLLRRVEMIDEELDRRQ
jgi:hypothetical protein